MQDNALLEVDGLSKYFTVQGKTLKAVQNASLRLKGGQTLGLVGESGSGKSTLGRTILRLLEPDAGKVVFDGVDLSRLSREQLRQKRQDMQMIFQDPLASLNSRMTVGRAIEDPMIIHKAGNADKRRKRVHQLLERVGLSPLAANAFPFELSGGQQQRVGIARALALEPKLIVCDEPVSALDVSVQIQIITLLQDLQKEMHLSYVFISHNLAVVEYLSDVVAVMYLGEIVESASVEEVFQNPQHPYTRVLIDSILKVPASETEQSTFPVLPGEIPSPLNPPTGCAFHPRCPLATDRCRTEKPVSRDVGKEHRVACHLAG